MANNSRINPMYVDTASSARLVTDTTEVTISSIVINASADTWSVVLKDGSGNVVFQATEALTGARHASWTPAHPHTCTGLVVDTLTDITNVLIYTT